MSAECDHSHSCLLSVKSASSPGIPPWPCNPVVSSGLGTFRGSYEAAELGRVQQGFEPRPRGPSLTPPLHSPENHGPGCHGPGDSELGLPFLSRAQGRVCVGVRAVCDGHAWRGSHPGLCGGGGAVDGACGTASCAPCWSGLLCGHPGHLYPAVGWSSGCSGLGLKSGLIEIPSRGGMSGMMLPRGRCGQIGCFPAGDGGKQPTRQSRRCAFDPGVGRTPWRRKWQPTPVFFPGASRGQRSLVG